MNGSPFPIRRAAPDEAPLLSALALRSKAYWGYDALFLAACRPALTLSPEYIAAHPVYVFEITGRIAGFYSLRDLGNGEADLDHLFVDTDAIGHGCGKRLCQHAVETAKQRGFSHLRIEADPNAESFYLAMVITGVLALALLGLGLAALVIYIPRWRRLAIILYN